MAIEMTPQEIEEIFREYNEAVARGIPIEENLAERMRDASVGMRGYTYELKQNLDRIKSSGLGLAAALKDGQTGASVYNNTIESAADALATFLKPLGPLGKIIGTIVSAGSKLISEVNKQTDALFKSYENLNRFGAGITTGVEGVMELSQQMGYTVGELDSFTALLGKNSQSLAMMSGTAAAGTKQFGDLVKQVSPQREMWRRLGLDVEQQNEAYAGYLRILTLTGQAQRRTTTDLADGSQEYLHNLVTLSKITGQTVDELLTQREALLSQQRFASAQRDLLKKAADAERANDDATAARFRRQADENEKLIGAVPKELRAGVADLTTGYVGTSKAAMQVYRGMPQLARKIMSQNYEHSEVVATGEREAAKRLDAFGKTLGGVGRFDETFGPLLGYIKLENQARSASFDERKRQVEEEKQRQTALGGATASQAKLREEQLSTTQNIQRAIGVLTGPVSGAMKTLATVTGEATTALGNIAGTNQRGAAPGPGIRAATPAPATPESTPAPATPESTPAPAAPAPPTNNDAAVVVSAPTNNDESVVSAPATRSPLSINPAIIRRQEEDEQRRAARRQQLAPTSTPASTVGQSSDFMRAVEKTAEDQARRTRRATDDAVAAKTVAPNATESAGSPKVEPNTQEFRYGGIATGPKSGYQTTLHGIEAVIPLAGGRSIPVEMPNFSTSMLGQMDLMHTHITKLDELINETRANNSLTQKLLKAAQV